jgi:hypothetical protein
MMINEFELTVIRARLQSIDSMKAESEFGPIPASVPYLEDMLGANLDFDDRSLIYSLLISECSRAKNDSLYIAMLRRREKDLENDPMSRLGLAHTLVIIKPELADEALNVAKEALNMAKAQDWLVKYCATSIVRIGLVRKDYDIVQFGLAELVADSKNQRLEDSGYEFDFLPQIEAQRCDKTLLKSYQSLQTN